MTLSEVPEAELTGARRLIPLITLFLLLDKLVILIFRLFFTLLLRPGGLLLFQWLLFLDFLGLLKGHHHVTLHKVRVVAQVLIQQSILAIEIVDWLVMCGKKLLPRASLAAGSHFFSHYVWLKVLVLPLKELVVFLLLLLPVSATRTSSSPLLLAALARMQWGQVLSQVFRRCCVKLEPSEVSLLLIKLHLLRLLFRCFNYKSLLRNASSTSTILFRGWLSLLLSLFTNQGLGLLLFLFALGFLGAGALLRDPIYVLYKERVGGIRPGSLVRGKGIGGGGFIKDLAFELSIDHQGSPLGAGLLDACGSLLFLFLALRLYRGSCLILLYQDFFLLQGLSFRLSDLGLLAFTALVFLTIIFIFFTPVLMIIVRYVLLVVGVRLWW